MKNGQEYMRKASSMCLTKAPESESPEDNIQPEVCSYLTLVNYNNSKSIKVGYRGRSFVIQTPSKID